MAIQISSMHLMSLTIDVIKHIRWDARIMDDTIWVYIIIPVPLTYNEIEMHIDADRP